MGTFTDYLRDFVTGQIKEHELVVWFDPQSFYADFVQSLTVDNVRIVRYAGSFFELRHAIDDLMAGEQKPRLLVYVPQEEEHIHDALAELTAVAHILKPSGSTSTQNTRPSVVTRRALKATLGTERAEALSVQVEAGKLGLADLDVLNAQQGGSPALLAVFGTTSPRDIAYAFLTNATHDEKIDKRGARADLATALTQSLGMPATDPNATCADLRATLARHLLTVEFLLSLQGDWPAALRAVVVPQEPALRELCERLAREWRNDWTQAEPYAAAAQDTERALRLANLPFTLEAIRDSYTFAGIDLQVQRLVQHAFMQEPNRVDEGLIALAYTRRHGYWARQRGDIGSGWVWTHGAGQLLLQAQYVEQALKRAPAQAESLLRAYTEGESPWCLLDTHHRHMERDWHRYEPADVDANASEPEALLNLARQRYMQVGGALAEAFTRAMVQAHFAVPGLQHQREIFAQVVKPAIDAGKTAYVLVDALRFEMARELVRSLDSSFDPTLNAALGTLPGITVIGMAALMPEAEGEDTALETRTNGGLALRVGGMLLKDRDSRVTWFKDRVSKFSGPVSIAKLEDMLPKPKNALDKDLKAARVILITSQEIDEFAEGDNIPTARQVMDAALAKLARLAHLLRGYGCQRIIFTADHGHLFGEELEDAMKLDSPGGETIDLHRRIWVGHGGTNSESMVRGKLAQTGLRSDLEFAVPVGFGAFKVAGGARAYFHGGLSRPEVVLPGLAMTVSTPPEAPHTEFTLAPTSRKLTSSIFVVRVTGEWKGLFPREVQRVRLELRQNKAIISEIFDATYGLNRATQEIELKLDESDRTTFVANHVVLRVMGRVDSKTVSLALTDVETGVELANLDRIEVVSLNL